MTAVEYLIGLKVPDNTAISAFAALKRMGFSELTHLARWNYYKFEVSAKAEAFLKKINQVDTIINPNKHNLMSPVQKYGKNQVFLLVEDDLGESRLLEKLHNDWKLNEIVSVEHGTLWDMQFGNDKDLNEKASNIAKALLVNDHYQKYRILG